MWKVLGWTGTWGKCNQNGFHFVGKFENWIRRQTNVVCICKYHTYKHTHTHQHILVYTERMTGNEKRKLKHYSRKKTTICLFVVKRGKEDCTIY